MRKKLWLWVIILLLVAPAGPVRAQTPAPPCSQENGPVGCLDVTLTPATLLGDLYVDGVPVAGQVNATQVIVEPNVRHTVEARTLRNVTAPDAFEYDNLSQLVTVAPNQTRDLVLIVGRPRERCTGSMALLRVVNWLRSTLFLRLAGPESKTISVPTGGEARVCVLPGTYTITQSAAGYYTEVDTQSLGGGCVLYRFWPSGGAAPPSDGCSNNPGDYRRP